METQGYILRCASAAASLFYHSEVRDRCVERCKERERRTAERSGCAPPYL